MTITSDDLKLFHRKCAPTRATPKRTPRKQTTNLSVSVGQMSYRQALNDAWLFILLVKNCYYCGRDCAKHGLPLEGDHMYPVFLANVTGYYATPIVSACKPCNMRKGPYPPPRGFVDVWVGRLLVGYVESKFAKRDNKPIPAPAERRIPCMTRPRRVL